MEELTKKSRVIGTMYAGDKTFFAVDGPHKLCDDQGKATDGWGWFCVESTPINLEMLIDQEVTPVYDAPVFIVNGALIFHLKNVPVEVEHINADYQWEGDDDEEPTPEELKEAITDGELAELNDATPKPVCD